MAEKPAGVPKSSTAAARHRWPPFYYGWVIVASMGVVTSVSLAMGGVNFGFFVKPMADDLDVSQAFFGWAQTARLVGFAATSFLIGRAIDRFGARIPLIVAGALMGVSVVAFSVITAGWHMVAVFFVIGAIGMHGGGGNLYASVPIAKWFIRKRGKAMAVMALGGPIGIAVTAPVTQLLISELGWRATWQILGLTGGVVIVVVALFFVRRQPQDMGLLPDGERPEEGAGEQQVAPERGRSGSVRRPEAEFSWTRAQAVRSATFWRLTLAFGAFMFAISTLGLFRVPFFVDEGFSPQLVALMFTTEAAAAALVAVPTGMALDRFQTRYVAAVGFLVMAVTFFATMTVAAAWQVFASGILFGGAISAVMILQNTIWPVYFGGAHVGAIRGASMPAIIGFSAAGAPLTGFIKDATGTYLPAWWAGVVLLVVGAVIILLTPQPQHPHIPSQPAEILPE